MAEQDSIHAETIEDFRAGWISPDDVQTERAPKNSFLDAQNVEINNPIAGLSIADGYAPDIDVSGITDTIIAVKKWSVAIPSEKEITVLITMDNTDQYHVLMYPNWNGSAWVNSWLDMLPDATYVTNTDYVAGNIVDKNIKLYPTQFGLDISFGIQTPPLQLAYYDVSNFYPDSGTPFSVNAFILGYKSPHNWNSGTPLQVSSVSFSSPAGAPIPDDVVYNIYFVGVFGSQRVKLAEGNAHNASGSGATQVTVTVDFNDYYVSPKLTGFEVYVLLGTTADSINPLNCFLLDHFRADDNIWTATTHPYQFVGDYNNTDITNALLSSTMLENLGYDGITLETEVEFTDEIYINGRIFACRPDFPDEVQFSLINGISTETDVFPVDQTVNYGIIVVNSGESDSVVGFAKTKFNDLLIIKERSVYLYDVQSGQSFAKRLSGVSLGIGGVSRRAIATTDNFIFWYDRNDVYMIDKSVNDYQKNFDIERISLGKMRQYWRKYLQGALSSSFAIWNIKLQEYWIYITDKNLILRFSPEFKNWNIIKLPDDLKWIDVDTDGRVIFLIDGFLAKYGYTTIVDSWNYDANTTELNDWFLTSHKMKIGDNLTQKVVTDLQMDYSADKGITIDFQLNDEVAVRVGNEQVLPETLNAGSSDRTIVTRQLRQGTIANKIQVKLSPVIADKAVIFKLHVLNFFWSLRRMKFGSGQ